MHNKNTYIHYKHGKIKQQTYFLGFENVLGLERSVDRSLRSLSTAASWGLMLKLSSTTALVVAPRHPPWLLDPVGTKEIDPRMPRTLTLIGGKERPRPPPEDDDHGESSSLVLVN